MKKSIFILMSFILATPSFGMLERDLKKVDFTNAHQKVERFSIGPSVTVGNTAGVGTPIWIDFTGVSYITENFYFGADLGLGSLAGGSLAGTNSLYSFLLDFGYENFIGDSSFLWRGNFGFGYGIGRNLLNSTEKGYGIKPKFELAYLITKGWRVNLNLSYQYFPDVKSISGFTAGIGLDIKRLIIHLAD